MVGSARCLRTVVAAMAMLVVFASPAVAATPSGFSPVTSPAIARGTLTGVDATGPADAWAVGYRYTGTGPRMVVEHWNGARWATVTLPSIWAGLDAHLFDVLAVSPTDVWAAGSIGELGQSRALIIHRSAAGWTRFTLNQIPTGSGQGFLYGLGGSSHTNLWAVGLLGKKPLALHFTGTSWSYLTTPSPPVSIGNPLQAVRVIGPTNVYFVGNSEQDGGIFYQVNPWALHWDGTSFGDVQYLNQPFEQPPNSAAWVNDLDAVGSSPIAAGLGVNLDNVQQGGVWRLSSGAWNPTTPFADPTSRSLHSMQVVSATNIWTVGHRTTTTGEMRPWIVHWNGSSWGSLGGPNPRPGDSLLNGISSVPGSSTLWAVGESGGTPLILRRN